MNKGIALGGIVCAALLHLSGYAFAASSAVQTMAEITGNLNHFPSDADIETLDTIVAGTTP